MARAKELVASVEKLLVIAFADELIEFGFGEGLLVKVTRSEVEFPFEQETSCFAAGGSCGLVVEGDVDSGHLATLMVDS